MSAQIIEFPMHRVRSASPVVRRPAPAVQPQVRLSVRIARKAVGWSVLIITAYLLFFGQASAIQPAEATGTTVSAASSKNYIYISVQSGDSLWSIAEKYSKGGDLRDFVQEIISLNNMQDSVVDAGMRLAIPRT